MRFLLVNGKKRSSWLATVSLALGPLGSLDTVAEGDAIAAVLKRTYALIVVDATAALYLRSLIGRIRAQRPGARVIVVGGPSGWRGVRDALRAGALDSIDRSANDQILQAAVRRALDLPIST